MNSNAIPSIFIGGTQVILEAFDPQLALHTIEKERCSLSTGVPLFAKLMLDIQKEKKYDISSFEAFIIGGAPLPIPLTRAPGYGLLLRSRILSAWRFTTSWGEE